MTKDTRKKLALDDAVIQKIRELAPGIVIQTLVSDLLFNYMLELLEDASLSEKALHPIILRKVAHTTREENEF